MDAIRREERPAYAKYVFSARSQQERDVCRERNLCSRQRLASAALPPIRGVEKQRQATEQPHDQRIDAPERPTAYRIVKRKRIFGVNRHPAAPSRIHYGKIEQADACDRRRRDSVVPLGRAQSGSTAHPPRGPTTMTPVKPRCFLHSSSSKRTASTSAPPDSFLESNEGSTGRRRTDRDSLEKWKPFPLFAETLCS